MATQPEALDKQEDEEELVPVETPPAEDGVGKTDDKDALDEGDDDADGEDERRAAPEREKDDEDAEGDLGVDPKRAQRQRRKERERRARERDRIEKQFLRQQVDQLTQRLSAVEGIALHSNEQTIDQRIAAAAQQAENAKRIMIKAIASGEEEDAAVAMTLRDQAIAEIQQLNAAKQQFGQLREQAVQPKADPRVEHYKRQWLADNADWFDKPGNEEDSAIARAVDAAVMREGYDAGTEDYWREVNRRLSIRFNGQQEAPIQPQQTPRRRPTPTGNPREQAPPSNRREVYVTPERKQAMIDAGMWDDPVKRNQMLRTYIEYDRQNADRQQG